jgi:light-regulated signal transduction histidine kinase (bacteriophytochrome)
MPTQDNIQIFVRKAILTSSVFLNQTNISSATSIENEALVLSPELDLKRGDKITFKLFDKTVNLSIENEDKILNINNLKIENDDDFMYNTALSMKIIDGNREMLLKVFSVSKNKVQFYVYGDNEDFFFNAIGQSLNAELDNGLAIQLCPKIAEIKEREIIMESEVNNNDSEEYTSIVSDIKKANEKMFFTEIEAIFEKAYCV